MDTGPNKDTLRQMVKEVLQECLEEKKGVLYDVLVEVVEDLALSRAITEGEDSELADREEVRQILSRQA